jgi:hypothetical protein
MIVDGLLSARASRASVDVNGPALFALAAWMNAAAMRLPRSVSASMGPTADVESGSYDDSVHFTSANDDPGSDWANGDGILS